MSSWSATPLLPEWEILLVSFWRSARRSAIFRPKDVPRHAASGPHWRLTLSQSIAYCQAAGAAPSKRQG